MLASSDLSLNRNALLWGGALSLLAMAFAVLAGWALHVQPLVQFVPGYSLMQPNTALGFLLSAVALLCLLSGWAWGAEAFAVALLLLSGLTLAEHVIGADLRIDTLLIKPFLVDPLGSPGRMSAATALSFSVASTALLSGVSAAQYRMPKLVPLTASVVLIVLPSLAALGYLSRVLGTEVFMRLQGMAIHTAAGFLVIGLVLAFYTRRTIRSQSAMAAATPFVAAFLVVLLGGTFSGFQWMMSDGRARTQVRFANASANLADDFQDRVGVYALALRGAAQFVEQGPGAAGLAPTASQWSAFVSALNLGRAFPGIRETGYAARRSTGVSVAVAFPINDSNRALLGYDLATDPARRTAMEHARDTGEPTLSSVVTLAALVQPEAGVLIFMPVYRTGAAVEDAAQRAKNLVGFVFARFEIDQLVQGIVGGHYAGLRVELFDGPAVGGASRRFYDNGAEAGAPVGLILARSQDHPLNVLNRRWTLRTTPLPGFARDLSQSEPWILLGSGLVISALLTLAVWQLLNIQERRRSLSEAQRLNEEIAERLRISQVLQAERLAAQKNVEALNAELAQRATALESANKDLDSFAHMVSHDLQQPVAGVIGYSALLLEDHAEAMDADVKRLVEQIQEVGTEMSQMVDGLLMLSRVVRDRVPRDPVDLSALAHTLIADLQAQHPERIVQVAIAPGLSASGDRQLVRQVLANLISNAWKYSGRAASPRIEVGIDANHPRHPFFVRDNGVGFDMADAPKLFEEFQRLPTSEGFDGNGIGLDTVHRIVQRHGGEVWAEGKVGEGATFYFTLGA